MKNIVDDAIVNHEHPVNYCLKRLFPALRRYKRFAYTYKIDFCFNPTVSGAISSNPNCFKENAFGTMKNYSVKQTTILWADDDPDELMLMREVLYELDSQYYVIEATNGREVLQYLDEAKHTGVFPCLIVLDLNMPILNGKETLAHLKQDDDLANIPIVMFTTSGSPLDKHFCEQYGTEMLTKPLTFATLKQVVQKLLHMCAVSVDRQ